MSSGMLIRCFLVVAVCFSAPINAQSNDTTVVSGSTLTSASLSVETSTSPTSSPSTSSPSPTPPTTVKLYQHITPVRKYGWTIALIVLASVGILSIIALEIYFMVTAYMTNLLKQWRSLWLGQLLLFALFCSYLTMFAFLPYPSSTTCGIIRFCVGVCYAMSFSVVLVKLIVLSFENVPDGVAALLFLFVWCVQVVIDIQWLITSNPNKLATVDKFDNYICTPGFTEHVQSLVYVMFLIFLCTITSLCVPRRSDGSSRRDVLFIGLASAFTISIWIVWILLGFLENDSDWHDPCVAFGLLTTTTVLLVFMFLPKIHQLNRIEKMYDVNRPVHPSMKTSRPPSVLGAAGMPSANGSVVVDPTGKFVMKPTDDKLTMEIYAENQNHQSFYIEDDDVLDTGDVSPTFDPNALYIQHPLTRKQHTYSDGSVKSAPNGHVVRDNRGNVFRSTDNLHETRTNAPTGKATGRPAAGYARSEPDLGYSSSSGTHPLGSTNGRRTNDDVHYRIHELGSL